MFLLACAAKAARCHGFAPGNQLQLLDVSISILRFATGHFA
jgi:hypothetical protein